MAAIDWLRGIAMVLMAVGHASEAFNAGRFHADSPAYAGDFVPVPQLLTRFVPYICAPAFVFLSGTVLALSRHRRAERGQPAASLDRRQLIRGLVLVALQFLWISPLVMGRPTFGILYAIGAAMILLVFLRRLGRIALLVLALGYLAAAEALLPLIEPSAAAHVLVGSGLYGDVLVLYPTLPWLAVMCIGWCFGSWLVEVSPPVRTIQRTLFGWGAGGTVVFVILRTLDAYGNMGVSAPSSQPLGWMIMSKYPPSLAFVALEGGIIAVVLAGLLGLQRRTREIDDNGLLLVLGQSPLVFYLLHYTLLVRIALWLDMYKSLGLVATFVAAAAVVPALYPVCRWYRNQRRLHPGSPVFQYL